MYSINEVDVDIAHCACKDQPITVVGPLREVYSEDLLKLWPMSVCETRLDKRSAAIHRV